MTSGRDIESHTVYLFYYENQLYAWTNNRKLKSRFLKERGKKSFLRRKVFIGKYYFEAFHSRNHNTSLMEIPLYVGNNWITLVGTEYESNILDEQQSIIYDEMTNISQFYKNSVYKNHLSNDVLNLIFTATQIVSDERDHVYYGIVEIDTFSLFFELFKGTFTLEKEKKHE